MSELKNSVWAWIGCWPCIVHKDLPKTAAEHGVTELTKDELAAIERIGVAGKWEVRNEVERHTAAEAGIFSFEPGHAQFRRNFRGVG